MTFGAALLALFAFTNPIDVIGDQIAHFLDLINSVTHNYGWSLIVLAFAVRLVLFPLYAQQFKSMKEMQALGPYIKRLQTRYKDNKQKQQEEMLKLYREHGVNPLGGCLPVLAQLPILYAVYHAIALHNEQFKHAGWLWIGSDFATRFHPWLAGSLFAPDKLLTLLYAVSLYFSMKITPTMSMDAQQQQMMKIQSLLMPVMFFFIGQNWASGFILYWLSYNVLQMLHQWVVMRAPSRIPSPPAETPATLAGYPLDCPSCNERLVVLKGSKCEKCGAKVRKIVPASNGAVTAAAASAGAPALGNGGGKTFGIPPRKKS